MEDVVVLAATYLLWEWRRKPSSAVSRRLHCWRTAFKRGRIFLEEEEDVMGRDGRVTELHGLGKEANDVTCFFLLLLL